MDPKKYSHFLSLLSDELLPALGCTEPIAIAHASAVARKYLKAEPTRIVVKCSPNIYKNVKGVVVPSTESLVGICAAAAIGFTGGNPELGLQVLRDVTQDDIRRAHALLQTGLLSEEVLDTEHKLHIVVLAESHETAVEVEVRDDHTNIVRITVNGTDILRCCDLTTGKANDKSSFIECTIMDILEFSHTVQVNDVSRMLDRQIELNMAIAEEGITHSYGSQIGKTILSSSFKEVATTAEAYAAAGSDARMGGCDFPVIINSGSGNQGITVSVPLVIYAKSKKCTKEELYRALVLSNLVAIYQRSMIGRLSAYCGVVNASAGVSAGIAFLDGCSDELILEAVSNTLACLSGVICDGAKASCAAKIALGVRTAFLGAKMAEDRTSFKNGQGIVKETPDETIRGVARLANEGMAITDQVIIKLMAC